MTIVNQKFYRTRAFKCTRFIIKHTYPDWFPIEDHREVGDADMVDSSNIDREELVGVLRHDHLSHAKRLTFIK